MFNPQANSHNQSYRKSQYQQNIAGGVNSSTINNGPIQNQQSQYDNHPRNSQLNISNQDQFYKASNVLQNQSFSQKQPPLSDKRVLNQNLQMMLSNNQAQKLNQSYMQNNTNNNNIKNGEQPQGNILNQTMQTNGLNTTLRKEQLQLELRDQKTFAYCSRWIHIGLVCIYSIAAVIVSSILIYQFPLNSDNRYQLDLVIDNWQQEMIEDIDVIELTNEQIKNKTTPPCAEGYQKFFKFQGQIIMDGCNCLSSSYSRKELLQFPCEKEHLDAKCTDVKGLPSSTGYNWKTPDGVNTFTVCAKKIIGLTYSSIGSQTSCKKQCGGETDETKICVEENQKCPINYLYFGANPEINTIPDLKEKAIGSYKLFYSNKGPGAPIVETRVTKGDDVCLNNKLQNLYIQSVINPLLNMNYTELCTKTDKRFVKLFSLDEKLLYEINYYDQDYLKIPLFELTDTELYYVYTRSFIPLSQDKRSDGIEKLQNSVSEYSNVHDANVSVLVTSAFYLFFIGIIYSITSILNILSKRYLFKQYLYDINPVTDNLKSTFFKRLWLKVLFSIIQLVSLLVAFIITIQNYIYLRYLNQGTIGDSYMITLIKNLKSEYNDDILWFIVSNFIYFCSLIVIEIFVLVPLCSKKLKENTDVKLSKKYVPKSDQGRPQNHPNNNNNKISELPEYQTHNIYGGNGVNTTINPFVQQMSVLGADIITTNNRSVHMGPGGYNSHIKQQSYQMGGIKLGHVNSSVINQSILPPEIKDYQNSAHSNNNVLPNNSNANGGQYKPPLNIDSNRPSSNLQLQQQNNSITNRMLENGSSSQQTLPAASPNQNQNDNNNHKVYQNKPEQYQQFQANDKRMSQFNNRNLAISLQSQNVDKNNQQTEETNNYANQTIDLDFQSNQQVIQYGGSHLNDISNDFGLQSITGEIKKNQKLNYQQKNQYSIDKFLPTQGSKVGDYGGQIQPIPEVDSYRNQAIGGQENQRTSTNNQDNQINYTGKSTGNLDKNNMRQDYNQNAFEPNYGNNNNNINRNIVQLDQDYNIRDDANNYSNTMNEYITEQRMQPIKNTEFNANQQHRQSNFSNNNNNNNINNNFNNNNNNPNYNQINNNNQNNQNHHSIYSNNNNNINNPTNKGYNQQIAHQAQNRVYDKNDQDVDDPDMFDINLPAYNQKFF